MAQDTTQRDREQAWDMLANEFHDLAAQWECLPGGDEKDNLYRELERRFDYLHGTCPGGVRDYGIRT